MGKQGRDKRRQGGSIRVDDEPREGAVLVGIASMHLASIQLDEDFITHVQVQNHTVASVVIVLISILCDGTGTDLGKEREG